MWDAPHTAFGLSFSKKKKEEKLWCVHVARKPILPKMERSVVAVRVQSPYVLTEPSEAHILTINAIKSHGGY